MKSKNMNKKKKDIARNIGNITMLLGIKDLENIQEPFLAYPSNTHLVMYLSMFELLTLLFTVSK